MKTKYLVLGLLAVALLLGLWFAVEPQLGSPPSRSTALLEGVSADSLQKLRILKNEQEIELRRGDRGWLLASRADYPADANKVRSLLLKLFDLGSAQTLPSSAKSYAKLGVAEDSFKEGHAKVQLFANSDEPEAEILLGKSREGTNAGGQYVRRQSGEAVSLISIPVNLDTEVQNWLETQVVNVREAVVYAIEQYTLADGEEKQVFAFKRQLSENGEFGRLELEQPDATTSKLEESVVAQVRGALENVRMSDVRVAGTQSRDFDAKTVFMLSTGIQYVVRTASAGEQFEAEVSVNRPEPLLQELQELQIRSEERRAREEAIEAAAAEATEEEVSAASDDTTDAVTTEEATTEKAAATPAKATVEKEPKKQREPLIRLASAEEASELQERFARWVYILPEFQAKKFRYSFEDLLQKEVSADDVAAAAGQ